METMEQPHPGTAADRVRDCREALAALITQRSRCDADAVALQSAREEHAYDALTGNGKAKRHLDSVNAQFSALRDRELTISSRRASSSAVATRPNRASGSSLTKKNLPS